MTNKIYAPVKITTLCRYEHFKRCIESLARCTGSDQTEIFIGLDYPSKQEHWDGYNKISKYIDSINGFKAVYVFRRETNYGPHKNSRDLLDRIAEKYDRYITTEDDNEFSPNFLEYINEGLEKYKDNSKVLMICGYNYKFAQQKLATYKYNIFPFRGMMAWGYGTWVEKANIKRQFVDHSRINEYLNDRHLISLLFKYNQHVTIHRLLSRYGLQASSDLLNRIYIIVNDLYCILPIRSKVRNWGFDGSGWNCSVINGFESQEIDDNKDFKYDEIELKDYPETIQLYNRVFNRSWILKKYIEFEYFVYKNFKMNLAQKGTLLPRLRKHFNTISNDTI